MRWIAVGIGSDRSCCGSLVVGIFGAFPLGFAHGRDVGPEVRKGGGDFFLACR